ncbi:MAG: hypothetical protein R3F43_28795 [bacterium]
MFIGHYAAALAVRRQTPDLPRPPLPGRPARRLRVLPLRALRRRAPAHRPRLHRGLSL